MAGDRETTQMYFVSGEGRPPQLRSEHLIQDCTEFTRAEELEIIFLSDTESCIVYIAVFSILFERLSL